MEALRYFPGTELSKNLDLEDDDLSAQPADESLKIPEFSTTFHAPVGWLADVLGRIDNSVFQLADSYESACEWLDEEVAYSARRFFENSCDLLPTEPHLYGTENGELVAEFETDTIRMTSVFAPHNTVLFGYRCDSSELPRHIEIQTGSNRARDEVRDFSEALGIKPNGEKVGA